MMIDVTIRKVADLHRGDYQYLRVFNIIVRKCMEFLDLKLLGRNFFDPRSRVKYIQYLFFYFLNNVNFN